MLLLRACCCLGCCGCCCLYLQNASSAFGAFLDPVADKLMVATVLVLLSTQPLAAGPLAGNAWVMPVATLSEYIHLLPVQSHAACRQRIEVHNSKVARAAKWHSSSGSCCSCLESVDRKQCKFDVPMS
jgi:hypothetical protein